GTQTLIVYDTISLSKQISGYEVGVGIFRFFGNELFDVNIGAKNQEPLQLGVRTSIEAAVMELVASVADVDPSSCMPESLGPIKWGGADPAVASAKETFRATKTFRLSDDDRVVQRVSKLPPLSKSEAKVAEAKPLRKMATVQADELAIEFKPD